MRSFWSSTVYTFERGLGEGACLPSEILHRFGGVLRLRGVHADEPDGVILPLMADPEGIAVNHPLDLDHDRIELSGDNERRKPGNKDAQAD